LIAKVGQQIKIVQNAVNNKKIDFGKLLRDGRVHIFHLLEIPPHPNSNMSSLSLKFPKITQKML